MQKTKVKSFKEYFEVIDALRLTNYEIILYRGQSANAPLLPSIARTNPIIDTTEKEREMLAELKRRTQLTIKTTLTTDWEWLVYAQHFGMKTRLLDWSSNPLAALWFACSAEHRLQQNSYVYIFTADNSLLINTKEKEDPFKIANTRILRPALNNERIIAQSGWFTAHRYSAKVGKFINLEMNKDLKQKLIRIEVPGSIKKEILKALSIFGVHSQSLFPDIGGICSHLNWMYTF